MLYRSGHESSKSGPSIFCSRHALCKVQYILIACCPQSSVNMRFTVDLPTNEVPSLLFSGLYSSFSEALGHRTYETRCLTGGLSKRHS